jgi:lipoate-protein ligase A
MAVDHALLESVQRGAAPVLRLYRWQPACLSFGRHQHTRHVYDPDAIAAAGHDVVRRPTGGLAVLHDRELTYCVLASLDSLGGPRSAYRTINQALVEGLRQLGVPAGLAGPARPADPRRGSADPCFHAPAEGEVTARGGKLVGSAQRCEAGALLQHGSILIAGSQARVGTFTRQPAHVGAAADPGSRDIGGSITLSEIMGRTPDIEDVAEAVALGFARVLGIPLAPATLTGSEIGRVEQLTRHYEDPDWTWRL